MLYLVLSLLNHDDSLVKLPWAEPLVIPFDEITQETQTFSWHPAGEASKWTLRLVLEVYRDNKRLAYEVHPENEYWLGPWDTLNATLNNLLSFKGKYERML